VKLILIGFNVRKCFMKTNIVVTRADFLSGIETEHTVEERRRTNDRSAPSTRHALPPTFCCRQINEREMNSVRSVC